MIHDKTEYFMKIRQKPCEIYTILSTNSIKTSLLNLGSSISQLENKIEMNTLPNFGSKEKKAKEIMELKEKIKGIVEEIERDIGYIKCEDIKIKETVQQYYLEKLKAYITKYRRFEQKMLIKNEEIKDNCINDNNETMMLQETVQRNNQIKSSIYGVTNTLIQLKTALKAQTSLIDTIDGYFELY
jgi:hypothetical protein